MKTIKPRKPRGIKLDGTRSLDMCSCCIAFGCDPMAMSPKFRQKIDDRRRKGLCPACGQPKSHCQCKSRKGQTGRISGHNNRKLRSAKQSVADREAAAHEWDRHYESLGLILGEELCSSIGHALHFHKTPDMPWAKVKNAVLRSGADPDVLVKAWTAK